MDSCLRTSRRLNIVDRESYLYLLNVRMLIFLGYRLWLMGFGEQHPAFIMNDNI